MKANLIEMLKAQGFSEVESKNETIQQCNGVILQRDWSRDVEVAFHGSYLETYTVRVFVNRNSGICTSATRRMAGSTKTAGTIPSASAPTMPSWRPPGVPGMQSEGGKSNEGYLSGVLHGAPGAAG
mgnify:CR=1 FL=1